MARIVSANSSAPPSLRSSRLTLVMTAYRQPQCCASFGYTPGFIVIGLEGSAFLNGAESAAPRTHIAENHERGRPAIPAFADIRAGSALADCMQFEVGDKLFQLAIIFAYGSRRAQPGRTLKLRRFPLRRNRY